MIAPTDTWAQSRSRSSRKAKSRTAKRAAKAAPKVPPKIETKGSSAVDPVTGDTATTATTALPQRGPARIDFDDRLIQGQTNKSGAVYLYDRKELKTRSMIRERESFRSETLSTVYDP
ncbi:hypothetical protein [Corallococcus macrosporus]|uniref:Uncharacterized protein n=1 Tax=Myxococcus fulvus (strain ATCC BAA-855 / HW-1) TaxID=483219 RepID=F8CDZ9_MYXFH|nr:hypothetical protein [Corallococcus macrosporus]AEI62358.1 hypothetical protein LILAB_02155 [Corallococcus macrosporus]